MNSPRALARGVRRQPGLLLRGLIHLMLSTAAIVAALAAFGHLGAFASWGWLALLWTGQSVGARIAATRASSPA